MTLIGTGPNISCGNSYCSGTCISYRPLMSFDYQYECFSDTVGGFCSGWRPALFLMYGCFAMAILLPYVATRVLAKFHASLCSLIISLIQSACFSVFIMGIVCLSALGFEVGYVAPIPIMIFAMIIMNILTHVVGINCCHKTPEEHQFYIRIIFFSKIIPREDAEIQLENARKNPPILEFQGNLNFVTRGSRGGKSITYYQNFPFKDYQYYNSWEVGVDEIYSLPEASFAVIFFKSKFLYSNAFQQNITEKHKVLMAYAKGQCNDPSLVFNSHVYEIQPYILASTKTKVPAYYRFFNSCFGKFLYGLSHIIGLNIMIDAIFVLRSQNLEVNVIRRLSLGDDLPERPYHSASKFGSPIQFPVPMTEHPHGMPPLPLFTHSEA